MTYNCIILTYKRVTFKLSPSLRGAGNIFTILIQSGSAGFTDQSLRDLCNQFTNEGT